MSDEVYSLAKEKMGKTISAMESEFSSIRAGQASPVILDRIMVDYYGVPTAINQMASVSVAEARILQIQPYDATSLKAIEKAIQASDIGINPQNDGRIIRLAFPPLTEERRRELTKQVAQLCEEAKVSVRSIRRDALDRYKTMKKASEITEDDLKDSEKQMQKLTDEFCEKVDKSAERKTKEILEI